LQFKLFYSLRAMFWAKYRKSRLGRIFLNKYSIVLIAFAVIITFFDNHNLINRFETHRKIKTMGKELDYYKTEIQSNKRKMNELRSGKDNLEKFAREQYLMKRENEDVFIIKE